MKKTKTPRPDSMMEYLNTLTKTVKDRAQESLDDFRTRMAPILAKGDALVQICGGFAQAHQAQYEARRAALEDPTLRGGYPHLTPIVTAILAEIDGALALLSGVPVQVARLRRLVEGMKARNARYFFASDHSITPLVSYDSYRYALDVYREHMTY